MSDARLHISLLGEFSLVYRGQSAARLSGERPIALLAYLLLHRDTAVSRQQLAFTLWPDSSDSQARANLRNLFYTLRQTLPDADAFLAADAMTLQWRSDADVVLDVAEFEAALAAARTAAAPADKMKHLETAVSCYKGDLLPGNYDDWIIPLREELRQSHLDALHQLITLLEQQQEYRAAARYSQRLLQQDPLDETAYVQLMRQYARGGDRAGVRRVYEACVLTLRRELDVAPGPATQAAYAELLRQEAPASVPEPLPVSHAVRPLPLPVPATPFIGREAELAQIAELLADPACRLLTIVGPGGIGKTRLALQTAVGHQPVFADGVAWVGLNALQRPEQLAAAIAESLNYRLRGAGSPEAELLPLLASKELLLGLDNFEHLLSAADLLVRLLEQTTAVKLLVTSRQSLELSAEWRFDLNALPLPEETAADSLADNSAVQLFVQSGRRTAGTFSPTAADFAAIVHICHLVGGMPLGIELAASWLRLLSCAEIAQEIEKSLDFLTVTHRNLPPRHRSLRAVFDYSWELLSLDERQMLSRLSIFRGGFTREAAARVAGADLPRLSALVDRSLVQRTAVGRYSLHNVIRQFALEQLRGDAAAFDETTTAHGRYYLQWLAGQDAVLRGPRQKDGLTAVAADLANIRAAWQWAAEQRQVALVLDSAFPLFYFYELRGRLLEGETAFYLVADAWQRETETADADETRRAISALNIYQAYLAFRQGRLSTAEILLRIAVDNLDPLFDETLLGHALFYFAILEWTIGRFSEAVGHLKMAWMLAERRQNVWEAVMAQVYLGMVWHDQGLLAEARAQLTAVYPAARELGDPRLLSNALLISGRTNLMLGQLDEAEQQLLECLGRARETGDPIGLTYATHFLGMVKQAQGDLAAARRLIEQSMTLYADFNDVVGLERAGITLGFLEMAAGNLEAAQTCFASFLRIKQRTHSMRYVLSALMGMATLRARSGDALTALVWATAVLRHPGLDWEARRQAEALRAELEPVLSATAVARAEKEAAEKPFADILADASQANGLS